MIGYGQDTDCTRDLPLIDTQVQDVAVVANAIYRRLTTPAGALAYVGDDPSYGFSLTNLINAAQTRQSVAAYQSIIRNQVLQDPRIIDVQIRITVGA